MQKKPWPAACTKVDIEEGVYEITSLHKQTSDTVTAVGERKNVFRIYLHLASVIRMFYNLHKLYCLACIFISLFWGLNPSHRVTDTLSHSLSLFNFFHTHPLSLILSLLNSQSHSHSLTLSLLPYSTFSLSLSVSLSLYLTLTIPLFISLASMFKT